MYVVGEPSGTFRVPTSQYLFSVVGPSPGRVVVRCA